MTDTILSELYDDKKRYTNTISGMIIRLHTYITKLKLRDHSQQELACLEMAIHFLEHSKECLK